MDLLALRHVESSQTRDWTSAPCTGRWILLHCKTREILALYFHLPFLLWIKILHSTYYTLLLTVTSRNRDRRRNEGKRIKPPSAGLAHSHVPSPTHNCLSQSNPTPKGVVLEWQGQGQVSRRGNLWCTQVEWTGFMKGFITQHKNEANGDTVSSCCSH